MTRRLVMIGALLLMAFVAAQAQSVKPAPPEDPEADSEAAMKFTVHDSKKGGGDWEMWDIGRPHPMQGKGEFGDNDAIGVAAGKRIPTDCSVYWDDPDTHKILCFSTQASLVYFLEAPQRNAVRAEKRWREMQKKLVTPQAVAQGGSAAAKCRVAEVNPVTNFTFCIDPVGAPLPQPQKPCQGVHQVGEWTTTNGCVTAPTTNAPSY